MERRISNLTYPDSSAAPQNDNAAFGIHFSGKRLFAAGRKNSPPIIGATCAFDAKIYKIVDSFFVVSLFLVRYKNFFQLFDFSFQLPSLLIENQPKSCPSLRVFMLTDPRSVSPMSGKNK